MRNCIRACTGEFPWMVAILLVEDIFNEPHKIYQCGGALIHPLVILTAAHCVAGNSAQMLKVRAGHWSDTLSATEMPTHQDRAVKEVIMHDKFNRESSRNDIALLIMDKEVEIMGSVNTVCLPPIGLVFDNPRCYVSGWGKAEMNISAGLHMHTLKRIDLATVANIECESQLRATRLRSTFKLHTSFICAGGHEDKGDCVSDDFDGSPLVCPIFGTLDRYYFAGIVSWGIGCSYQKPGISKSYSYNKHNN